MIGESSGASLGGAIFTPCGPKEDRWDKKTNNCKVMGYMDTERHTRAALRWNFQKNPQPSFDPPPDGVEKLTTKKIDKFKKYSFFQK